MAAGSGHKAGSQTIRQIGRPSAKAVENHGSLGERNPIEGKFGQAKNG